MIFKYKTMSQCQLGTLFGVSSHVVGKWLIEVGLRTNDKRPTWDAHHEGYCESASSGSTGYHWVWHSEKTVERFIQAGHRLISELPEDLVESPKLHGPFRLSSSCSNEVCNCDGTTAVRTSGQRNAEFVLKLLNLAHQHGVISRAFGNTSSEVTAG
jgi:hypothetical protein